jgi:hypothetical protein
MLEKEFDINLCGVQINFYLLREENHDDYCIGDCSVYSPIMDNGKKRFVIKSEDAYYTTVPLNTWLMRLNNGPYCVAPDELVKGLENYGRKDPIPEPGISCPICGYDFSDEREDK